MNTWRIKFKIGAAVYVQGSSLPQAIIRSGLRPFLVIDVESITQTK